MLNETIILCSNVSSSEKLKSLAALNVKSFNTRYFSTYELALFLLERSGVVLDRKFITNEDLAAHLYHKIKAIDYFKKLSYNDVLSLLSSVNDLRHYIVGDEKEAIKSKLPKDKFLKKNEAIIEFYNLLTNYLGDKYIDELGVIRYAYEHTKTFPNINYVIYEGDKINRYKLDIALLDKAAGREVRPTKVLEKGKHIDIKGYTKSFSQVNEIEHILNYIYANAIHFDECLIASADPFDYATILTNYQALLGFNLTIGIGTNIINTNPGRIYSLLCDFLDSHYHTDYLKRIFKDESFDIDKLILDAHIPDNFDYINKTLMLDFPNTISLDSILTTVGDLRISFDSLRNEKKVNEYLTLLDKYQSDNYEEKETTRRLAEKEYLINIVAIFNEGLINFINEYSKKKDDITDNALEKIVKYLEYQEEYHIPDKDIRKTIFKQKVAKKSPEEGSLYFTSISNASSCLRKHLFLVGLSSSNYPGKNKEDAILLDRDYKEFGEEHASSREINDNKATFFNLIDEATNLGVEVHLSYAYYNSITLKNQNASSVVFNIYQKENGMDKTIIDFEDSFPSEKDRIKGKYYTIKFFDTELLPVRSIARQLMDNHDVKYDPYIPPYDVDRKEPLPYWRFKKSLSASAINLFIDCPYQFYLSKILGIPQPEEIDIFEIIPANDLGTIAHSLLEHLDKKNTSKDEFLLEAEKRFKEYFIIHQNDNEPLIHATLKDFLKMMNYAYEMELKDKCNDFLKEKDIEVTHKPSGISIHGFPDKVLIDTDGYAIVVDYKTGRSIKHNLDDPRSLLQCVLYAYILENSPETKGLIKGVKGFEYRYIRKNEVVSNLNYNITMDTYYEVLAQVLDEIKKAYETGIFIRNDNPNKGHCSHCYYRGVCPRNNK